jgi:hypothetical protein
MAEISPKNFFREMEDNDLDVDWLTLTDES